MRPNKRQLCIGFVHPDLGLGGAERLIIDAALCLQEAGHRVSIFTAHHDRNRCFEETRNGMLDVRVCGNFLPAHVRGHLRAPCAIVRMAYLACAMIGRGSRFDIIFCDLVPHVLPLLRLLSQAKLIFYCHFPDRLLTPRRHFLYQGYRIPIDWLEATALGMADFILVNSQFTGAAFHRTFPGHRGPTPEVLYPGVDVSRFVMPYASPANTGDNTQVGETELIILSISRYEPKKNLGLAIEALALLRQKLPGETFNQVRLIIAGGYDERLPENRATLNMLQQHVRLLDLEAQVALRRSCSDAERLFLLWRCRCVVYTPTNEHFGFGPIEAMAAGKPVVAVRNGGPLETVLHKETGLLCEPTPDAFATALATLLTAPDTARRMGQAGQAHVVKHFSSTVFGARLAAIVEHLSEHIQ